MLTKHALSAHSSSNDSQFGDLEPAWDKLDDMVRVLDEIDYGLILVSPQGQIKHSNHLARYELARGRFIWNRQGRLAGLSSQHQGELEAAIRSATQGRRQLMTLDSPQERLSVACMPLRSLFEAASSTVLMMLARQTGTQNLSLGFFAKAHGLTPAEHHVLKGLCDGMTVAEIASAHQVAVSTVRTQIRSLREKTRVTSIRQLVQQVSALPPLVPSLRHPG